ncbi:glucokinase [Ensifer canadensis]
MKRSRSAILDKTSDPAALGDPRRRRPDQRATRSDLTNCRLGGSSRARMMRHDLGLSEDVPDRSTISRRRRLLSSSLAAEASGKDRRRHQCDPHGLRAVLGPGTGLGVGGRWSVAQHAWFPVPGEGGHVDIGPRTRTRLPGLAVSSSRSKAASPASSCSAAAACMNIYRAVCKPSTAKTAGPADDPAEVTAAGALAGDNPAAVEGRPSLFSTYLGRVAGDMALDLHGPRRRISRWRHLAEDPRTGAARIRSSAQAFEDKAPHSALHETIPTYCGHPSDGGTVRSCRLSRARRTDFGVATEGRRWRRLDSGRERCARLAKATCKSLSSGRETGSVGVRPTAQAREDRLLDARRSNERTPVNSDTISRDP